MWTIYICALTCSILAKQTAKSSALSSLVSVFLTVESLTWIIDLHLLPSITADEYVFLRSPSYPVFLSIVDNDKWQLLSACVGLSKLWRLFSLSERMTICFVISTNHCVILHYIVMPCYTWLIIAMVIYIKGILLCQISNTVLIITD